jgi:ketosteroid isomerase-like protein
MKQFMLLFFAAFILSCNNQVKVKTEVTAFSIDPVKAHIIEMNKTYGNRFTTNDSMFYIERYCKDAVVMGAQAPSVSGRDAIRNYFYNDGKNKEMTIELPAGNFYGNADMIIEEGTYNFPDGKGGSFDKGKFIAIWKEEDGKWKLYREIWNTDIAPTTTAGK